MESPSRLQEISSNGHKATRDIRDNVTVEVKEIKSDTLCDVGEEEKTRRGEEEEKPRWPTGNSQINIWHQEI